MLKCVAAADPDDPCGQVACAYNPFYTVWPYFFILVSLTLACVSLWMLAVGLKTFEALYMITVFEGFMIVSRGASPPIAAVRRAKRAGEGAACRATRLLLLLCYAALCSPLYPLLSHMRAAAAAATVSLSAPLPRAPGALSRPSQISGSISGNLVMNEKEGQPWLNIWMYCIGICIILCGLYILCNGEKASAENRLLSRSEMRPATESHSLSVEMGDDRPHGEPHSESAQCPDSPQCSPSGGSQHSQLSPNGDH